MKRGKSAGSTKAPATRAARPSANRKTSGRARTTGASDAAASPTLVVWLTSTAASMRHVAGHSKDAFERRTAQSALEEIAAAQRMLSLPGTAASDALLVGIVIGLLTAQVGSAAGPDPAPKVKHKTAQPRSNPRARSPRER